MSKQHSRVETETRINAHAWKNPSFKKKLETNPQAALRELGMENIPASLKIRVVEEAPNSWCIVLRQPPKNSQSMSEEELKEASGGSWPCVF